MSDQPVPEGQPPAEPTPDFGGASPEEISQALNMYRGLNNLDTRGQYLQQIVRPEYDGQFLRQVTAEPEQPADPWQQFEPAQEEYYEEPVAQAFDPRSLQPVFDQYGNQIEKRIFDRLGEMAQDQQVKDSASQAVQQANLPPAMSALIEQRVRDAQRLQPNRMASDLASEAAKQIAVELSQWQATPPAQPAPQGSVPGGPSPDTLQRPRTVDEALEYSRQVLNP